MDAMLLAAGLGTRLRPLTDFVPKALVEVAGVAMLERIARRLIDAGADRLIVNHHHLGAQVVEFVERRDGFGVEVVFSEEDERPLETGGGLMNAEPHFRGDAPFFLHNADILSEIPLREMYEAHEATSPLATLAVMERQTSRYLLFDDEGLLGRTDEKKGLRLTARAPRGEVRQLAFAGVHVVSPRIFGLVSERGAFSILDPYLRLVGEGERIEPFRIDDHLWMDIGKPEQLAEANRWLERSLPGSTVTHGKEEG